MNHLALVRKIFIDNALLQAVTQTDYVIDGCALGDTLGINLLRPWFGMTGFEHSRERQFFVNVLLGREKPRNQLGSNRLVLFGCHCGCDYCGVISCYLLVDKKTVIWRDIREEKDVGDEEIHTTLSIQEFKFDIKQYQQVINAYMNE